MPCYFDAMPTPIRVASRTRIAHLGARLLVCGALAASFACDRNIEPYQPGEEARAPDLARIFPAPAEAGPGAEGDAAQRAGSGQTTRGAVPPSRAEAGGITAAPTPAAPAGTSVAEPIRGKIRIGADLAGSEPPGAVLFVIARPQGARGGPPLAVLRIANPTFPLDFSIGPDNVMIPSMQFAGPISLSARLDADGNAMTRSAQDLSSVVVEGLTTGASDVELVLTEKG